MDEVVKNKGGRPKGVKDSKPRRTRKRALQTISSIVDEGYGLGEVALRNLQMVDYMIEKLHEDIELANELRDTAESTLDAEVFVKYLKQVSFLRKELLDYTKLRQSWVKDMAPYTDYKKGIEQVVQDEDGEYTTVGDLMSSRDIGPLIEGN